jgi:DNA polymerase-3 subunit gamma/tau
MSEYRVLARKYRPTSFDDLIGQDVLVQTLSNAMARNRLAHAFLLTGIRGIGKTTTARIIAKALNCIGEDGTGGPTTSPCGVCPNCVAITEDRHVDILEMDAASRTGVDDIRDIIDTVHYAPTSARYKIYIIDEVHMLSKNAFNALLKTLEEPPSHVKFIFATTEIRKIPVTVLSRCQRFDLRRIDRPMLAQHLANICAKESVTAEEEALKLIAQAAEGSVRDALSLLDQAIAHAQGEADDLKVHTEQVSAMLGLADKHRNYLLLEALFRGDLPQAIALLNEQHDQGADPAQILQELLTLVHMISQQKITAGKGPEELQITADDRELAKKMAESLSITLLTRSWQMLLKGLQETQLAPNPHMAAEMVLIRIAHMAELPDPKALITKWQNSPAPQQAAAAGGGAPAASAPAVGTSSASAASAHGAPDAPAPAGGGGQPAMAVQHQPQPQTASQEEPVALAGPENFEALVQLFKDQKEILLYHMLEREMRVVNFAPGHVEVNASERVAAELPGQIAAKLHEWTGTRWVVMLSREAGEPTLYEQRMAAFEQEKQTLAKEPLVAEVLEMFPGAEIIEVIK